MKIPRVLFAAPKSGSGKTMITCGIIELLKRKGRKVVSFKCGPDYIDPMFHRRVLGIPSGNLDTYFTDADTTRYLFLEKAEEADIAIVEGVMGFYDGLAGMSVLASTYEVSRVTRTPVVLVVDGKGASVTMASVIKGMKEFRKDSGIVGVILNRVSAGYYARIAKVIEDTCNVKVLGYLPEIRDLQVPSRHLGLISPEEMETFEAWIDTIAGELEKTIDLDGLLSIAAGAVNLDAGCGRLKLSQLPAVSKGIRIGIARDEAFSFYYAENLELLQKMGAVLVEFSPIHDREVPSGIQGLILGGGYPENYGKELSQNVSMRTSMKKVCGRIPVLTECGGFLYLQQELEGSDGQVYPMVGVFGGRGYPRDRLSRFGYVECVSKGAGLAGEASTILKGHEFHYWDCTENGSDFEGWKPFPKESLLQETYVEREHIRGGGANLYDLKGPYGCMVHTHKILAGFPHFYYYSNPMMVYHFLKACEKNDEEEV